MATIKDVAREAGVSISTVSNTLGGRKFVSAELRERVNRAVARLGYSADPAASGLKSRTSRVIGLVVPSIDSAFFPAVIGGLQEELQKKGYTINFYATDFDEDAEKNAVSALLANRADGIIVDSVSTDAEYLRSLAALTVRDKRVPAVALERDLTTFGVTGVTIDNRLGGELAARHLAQAGAKRIAHIYGRHSAPWSAERYEGFRAGLRAAGLEFDDSLLRDGDFTLAGGSEAVRSLLAAGADFDGIFAANDLSAVGALKALQAAGKSALLVGFDDTYVSMLTTPSVSTVAVPKRELGEHAGRKIVELIEKIGEDRPPENITLPVRLIARESTQNAK